MERTAYRQGRLALAVALAGGVLVPGEASAEPPLQLPWTCGDSYPVTNGHHTSTHTGVDEWAWDFGLPVGTKVVAPADGVVRLIKMNSSQGGCNSAYANDANYVVIDFGDGTEALLMHLQHASSNLSVGQSVRQGDVVGRVGLTGWVCGAHLHFQIQNTCSSWWCQSHSASFVGIGNPGPGPSLHSDNCPSAEPCGARLDGEALVIDDADAACFERVTSWFWPADAGFDGGHQYTWANDAQAPDTRGTWTFGVDLPGDYLVEVFVPEADASSELAMYEVETGAEVVTLGPIDQSAHGGWTELGVVTFEAGDERWVRTSDNTGEPRSLDRKLAFDAIRISPAPEPEGSTGEPEAPDVPDPVGSTGEDVTETTGGDEDAPPSATSGPAPGGAALPSQTEGSSGGCRVGGPGQGLWGLLALAMLGVLRRRRH